MKSIIRIRQIISYHWLSHVKCVMSTACRTSHQLQYRIVHATSRLQSLSTDKILVYPEALDGVPSDELEEREIQRLTLKGTRIDGKSYAFMEGSRNLSWNFAISTKERQLQNVQRVNYSCNNFLKRD